MSDELEVSPEIYNSVVDAFHAINVKPLDGQVDKIVAALRGKGVGIAVTEQGYVELSMSGLPVNHATVLEAFRKQQPELFTPDPARDEFSSRDQFNRGTDSEIRQAKIAYVKKFGIESWEAMPATKEQAERRAIAPSIDMPASAYMAMTVAEKSRLCGRIGAAAIGKILSRRG